MKFDYTYIALFGHPVFEPMVIVTNIIFFIFCLVFFNRLRKFNEPYGNQISWFIIFMGVSGLFGATAHAVHYQLGTTFFNTIFFISSVLNLIAVYFFLRAAYTNYLIPEHTYNKTLINFYIAVTCILIIVAFILNDFIIIKVSAGVVLIYSLIIHTIAAKKRSEKGSRIVAIGILVSFLSIIGHSLKISIHEWFNYKDIAHVIMIISLSIIYKGVRLNLIEWKKESAKI